MKTYLPTLTAEFQAAANPILAASQKAYLRNQFEFYGIKTPDRRAITKPFLSKAFLPSFIHQDRLVRILWKKPQREYHYFAQELAAKYVKQQMETDIALYEHMVTHQSWWDTVDSIAPNLIGPYFKKFPEQRDPHIEKWLASDHLWLQRSAIIFQLKYKDELDTECLTHVIESLLGSKEFFINKAIGWILRNYSRHDPDWVVAFVREHEAEMAGLSKREALRLLG